MKQGKLYQSLARPVAVLSCVVVSAVSATAQVPTSDWVHQIMRLPGNDQVAQSWQKQIERLERLILKGKSDRALTEGAKLAKEMVSLSAGGSGQMLGTVNLLRAVAAQDLGEERQALWLWQTNLQIVPELTRVDLAPFGEGVDVLQRHRPQVDEATKARRAEEVQQSGVTEPVKKHTPPPTFPPATPETGSVEVVVSVIIDQQGHPTRPLILRADGDVTLVLTALETFGQWEFEPATRDGEPIEFITNLTVRYRTKG
ncbi:MAG: energy transducer TonB [Acidobacteriota bacterium]